MTTKTKVILSIVALLTAYGFGRWSSPEKVVTVVKTVEVEKKKSKTETSKEVHRTTTITETTKPDGTKTVTTTIREDSVTEREKNTSENRSKSTEETKEITRASAKVTVSALAGIDILSPGAPLYGASLSKPVLGPITLGIWGLTNSVGGVSLGLTF